MLLPPNNSGILTYQLGGGGGGIPGDLFRFAEIKFPLHTAGDWNRPARNFQITQPEHQPPALHWSALSSPPEYSHLLGADQVSCKALPFCCASTRTVSKAVHFLAICLSWQQQAGQPLKYHPLAIDLHIAVTAGPALTVAAAAAPPFGAMGGGGGAALAAAAGGGGGGGQPVAAPSAQAGSHVAAGAEVRQLRELAAEAAAADQAGNHDRALLLYQQAAETGLLLSKRSGAVAAALRPVSHKAPPFCCASTVFLSKTMPFLAVLHNTGH
eukprot:SAG22_NODE_447_length_10412_cov_7.930088_9_plen_269_part_00